MKRFLVLAIAAVLVLGMAATAFADVNLSGEFRVRTANLNNITDGDSDANDHIHFYDQRMRIWLTANVADDVTVKTRFTTSNGLWDGATTSGGALQTTDYAWMVIKKWNTSFSIGRQPAKWGHKILVWGNAKDRIVITRKAGDIVYGGFIEKANEASVAVAGASDTDGYALLAKGIGGGGHKVDILYVTVINHQADTDGSILDVSYDGKAGPVAIFAEFIDKSGDLNETATGDNPGFILAGVASKFGPVSAHVAYASAANTFVADDDFTPTLAFGTSQVTGVMNFGESHDGVGDDTVSAIVLGAKMGLGDDMAVGVNIASGTLSDNDTTGDSDVTELDLYMTYNLATKTSLTAGIAQVSSDAIGDDAAMLSGVTIETKF